MRIMDPYLLSWMSRARVAEAKLKVTEAGVTQDMLDEIADFKQIITEYHELEMEFLDPDKLKKFNPNIQVLHRGFGFQLQAIRTRRNK